MIDKIDAKKSPIEKLVCCSITHTITAKYYNNYNGLVNSKMKYSKKVGMGMIISDLPYKVIVL
jgi:hypothetical protein